MNCGVSSSSVILYATAEWGLPKGRRTRVVLVRVMYWVRKAMSRVGGRRGLRGLGEQERDSLASEWVYAMVGVIVGVGPEGKLLYSGL